MMYVGLPFFIISLGLCVLDIVINQYIYCNNPTNNMKGAALHARCQAVYESKK